MLFTVTEGEDKPLKYPKMFEKADWVVLNDRATPLLARRCAQANSLDEWLFALIVLGDDRVVARTVIDADGR